MNNQTLNAIRQMIDAGADNNVILAVLAIADDAPTTAENIARPARVSRTISATTTRTAAPRAGIVLDPPREKPDTTRTVYHLTALGRKLTPGSKNPGGNNGAVIAYFASNGNAWADTREMRAAGVLAHGERDGKNKALESAIHGMKVRGWLTMRDKSE